MPDWSSYQAAPILSRRARSWVESSLVRGETLNPSKMYPGLDTGYVFIGYYYSSPMYFRTDSIWNVKDFRDLTAHVRSMQLSRRLRETPEFHLLQRLTFIIPSRTRMSCRRRFTLRIVAGLSQLLTRNGNMTFF